MVARRPDVTDERDSFNRPFTTGREFDYVREAIENGHLSGSGPFTERCNSGSSERIGSDQALLTHSCTAALEMAAMLARRRTRRRGRHALVHVRLHGERRRPPRRHARLRRRCADTLNIDESRSAPRSLRGPRRSSPCTTPASAATWTSSARSPTRRRRARRGRGPGDPRDLRRTAARQLRRARGAQLPRDEERALRRGRRAARQRPGATASAPRSCSTRAPTGGGSSAGRSTSTRGSTSAARTRRARSTPRSCGRSSRTRRRSPRAGSRSGRATTKRSPSSRSRASCAARSCPDGCAHNAHMYYLLLPTSTAGRAFIADLDERGHPCGLPLRPAPLLGRRATLRPAGGRAHRHRGRERPARAAPALAGDDRRGGRAGDRRSRVGRGEGSLGDSSARVRSN